MTDDELAAWTAGFLAAWPLAYEDGWAAGHDEHLSRCEPHWEARVQAARRVSERAGAAKEWRRRVLREGAA